MSQENVIVTRKPETGARKFWRIVLGTMVGFFFSCFIVSFLSFIFMIVMIASFSKETTPVKENSILKLTLQNEIVERSIPSPFDNLDLGESYNTYTGLNDILSCIKTAAKDDKIKGIYLNVSNIQARPATVKEIRDALLQFKESGKFIYAYSENYSQNGYYLASVADTVAMNMKGNLDLRGLAFQVMFYKGLFEKLDIDMQIIRHGKYKSAVEPYFLDKMSEANREQMTLLSSTLWQTMLDNIVKSRKISADSLNKIADNLLCGTAQNAIDLGLVDRLCYYGDVEKTFRQLLGSAENNDINYVSLSDYKKTLSGIKINTADKIAVVYAVGTIVDGKGNDDQIGSESLSKAIRKAYMNDKVKAIVLRVNSPGGSALASEVIWKEIENAKKAGKVVVASMGDYAASGGYYISCNADAIVAQPNTITGSIGVFGVIPSFQKFLKEKLGVTVDVVKTNAHSDYATGLRSLDETEVRKIEIMIEDIYSTFTQHVADGRKMDIAWVDSLGQGRVWAGADALKNGLVDQLGTMDDAIALAAKLAKVSDYGIEYYPKQKDWFTKILEGDHDDAVAKTIKSEMGDLYYTYEGIRQVMDSKGVQARMPMEIVIE
jgi:protease IV